MATCKRLTFAYIRNGVAPNMKSQELGPLVVTRSYKYLLQATGLRYLSLLHLCSASDMNGGGGHDGLRMLCRCCHRWRGMAWRGVAWRRRDTTPGLEDMKNQRSREGIAPGRHAREARRLDLDGEGCPVSVEEITTNTVAREHE